MNLYVSIRKKDAIQNVSIKNYKHNITMLEALQ